ncbi:MAG TPA: adenosylcobinamide-GDP ribazoletransferase [Thermoleophilaceae bacterium]
MPASAMRVADELRGLAAAVAFLTRVPAGRAIELGAPDVARGVVAFPLVGAAIGLATGATATWLSGPLPAGTAGAVALLVAVVLTGALHLDGLADTADAIGGRTREASLGIMRDPRVGSYGAVAIAMLLLIEASALAALGRDARTVDVVAAFALARAVAPAVAALLPYAREGDGLGRALNAREGDGLGRALTSRVRPPLAVAVALALVAVLQPRHLLALVSVAAACACGAAAFCRQRFGGMTGDTLGATIAVTQMVCLAVACLG